MGFSNGSHTHAHGRESEDYGTAREGKTSERFHRWLNGNDE